MFKAGFGSRFDHVTHLQTHTHTHTKANRMNGSEVLMPDSPLIRLQTNNAAIANDTAG